MSQEQKQKQAKSNYDGQEHESLRRGHEARTKEKVKDAVEDKTAHDRARNARFATTGEQQCETVDDCK
jgi:hypothetical protein